MPFWSIDIPFLHFLFILSDAKVLKAEGKFVIPGGVDSATHLHNSNNGSEDGPKMVDDFDSGSKAALLGGTTTVIDLVEPQKGRSICLIFNHIHYICFLQQFLYIFILDNFSFRRVTCSGLFRVERRCGRKVSLRCSFCSGIDKLE